MGYTLDSMITPSKPQTWANCSLEEINVKYLLELYNKICELPTRSDIKALLRKCVYSILVEDDANEEINFLNEVRKLLDEVKPPCNLDHLKIIEVIDEIYQFAVDKKIDENIRISKEDQITIPDDVLCLFETQHQYIEENSDREDMEEEEGEEGEEGEGDGEGEEEREDNQEQAAGDNNDEENDESCDYHSSHYPVWQRYSN